MNKDNDTKYSSFAIVIEEYDKILDRHIGIGSILSALYKLEDMFSNKLKFYFILHDSDLDTNGDIKRKHYHLVIELAKDYKKREYTIFRKLLLCLECSENVISLEHCLSLVSSVQYLIHKNDKDKTQYDIENIITCDTIRLNYLMQDIGEYVLTTKELQSVIEQEKSYNDILSRIGINNFNKYHSIICILFEENRKSKIYYIG